MNSTIAVTARRFALTLTVAGIAALGGIAVAPAASAAQDTGVVFLDGDHGPDAFVVTATGRVPVFFCEDVQPGKDGVVDDKDIARAAKKAIEEADRAARDADKVAYDANKDVRDAARKAAEDAAKAARDAQKAAQESVDRVMKQHNICLSITPGAPRF